MLRSATPNDDGEWLTEATETGGIVKVPNELLFDELIFPAVVLNTYSEMPDPFKAAVTSARVA